MLFQDKLLQRSLYPRGRKIFSQGDKGDAAYIVESGRIALYKHIGDKKVHLATVTKGSLFGEMAVIDGTDRMASAVALESSVLVAIPRTLVEQKMQKVGPFMKALILILLENLRNVHKIYSAKPRSVNDFSKVLDDFTDTLRQYVNAVDIDQFSDEMAQNIDKMANLLAEMKEMTGKINDRRSSIFPDDEQMPD